MRQIYHLLNIIILLNSGFNAAIHSGMASDSKNLDFGMANIEAVAVDINGKSTIAPDIIIRITAKGTRVESYGMSDEGGMILMPLPPGRYCYEAYSERGRPLKMIRKPSDRCFTLKKNSELTIGVEFESDNK
jgi:hypothetical protein